MNKSSLFDIYNSIDSNDKDDFISEIDSKLEVENKFKKTVCDYSWIQVIEDTMYYLDNIVRNPKKFIVNEEEIVKVEKSKKVTVESIKHLTQHSNYIQEYNPITMEVKPSKILNINKEEDLDMYENRFIYTLLGNLKFFISRMAPVCISGMGLYSNKTIKYTGTTKFNSEKIGIDINLNALNNSDNADSGNNIAKRIEKINVQLSDFMNSEMYKTLDKAHVALVRSPIKRTNVILKNPNFQKAMELWNYIESYDFNNVKEDNIDESYEDSGEFSKKMDESFLLNYLLMARMLEKGTNEKLEQDYNSFYINTVIKNFVENNNDITEQVFLKMVRDEFREIKHKKVIKLNRIRKIYNRDLNAFNKMLNKWCDILDR